MPRNNEIKQSKVEKEENWIDDVMERQEHDLKQEEEILSTVPNRIRHKWLDENDEE